MPWLHLGPEYQTKLCQTEPDEKIAGMYYYYQAALTRSLQEVDLIEPENTRFCETR